jgi:hypothetical protein
VSPPLKFLVIKKL